MSAVAPLVFFGTPDFALPTLTALAANGRTPALVVTQPARPAGRGQHEQQPPVARWALAHGVPLDQPRRVREPEFLSRLQELAPGIAVVVAFGQIFPAELLALPRSGCVNLHASLLPRHRGASPIAAAIAADDACTGVTTMRMEQGLDSGPILMQRQTPIGPAETTGELSSRLAALGAALMVDTLAALEAGSLSESPQDHGRATLAPRLSRESGRVDWSATADALARRLRALTPWPGMHAVLGEAPVKLIQVKPLVNETPRPDAAPPGTYLGLTDGTLAIAAGEGTVLGVAALQRPGRKVAAAADFANGERLRIGQAFS
jgi:methionyl-tRNA formyltransferase